MFKLHYEIKPIYCRLTKEQPSFGLSPFGIEGNCHVLKQAYVEFGGGT